MIKEIGSSQEKAERYLSTREEDRAKIIQLKLSLLLQKGSWGEISEACGTFPNGDGRNPRQKNGKCSVLIASQGLRFLRSFYFIAP